jgi:hypothetical protein
MSRFVEIQGRVALHRYLEQTAVLWPGWRTLRLWFPHEPTERLQFVLEAPDHGALPQPDGVRAATAAPTEEPVLLGDLWRRARPMRRYRAGEAAELHLLVVAANLTAVLQQLLVECPFGLTFVSLRATEGAAEMAAFLIRGEAGRFFAHTPPLGCTSYACDELPTGGLAALPLGWAVAPLSATLWPEGASSVLVYEVGDDRHAVEAFTITEKRAIANLVEPLPAPKRPMSNPLQDLRPTPWRVVRAGGWRPPPTEGLDDRDRVRVVFRIRTFVRTPSGPGDERSYRGHDLGHALLQVLDECQAGLLPEIRYAAVQYDAEERWHLLYVAAADARLLEAWSILERFEYVPQAEEHGLHVFVAATSRMMPPIGAMLDGEDGGASVAERLRNMLGQPSSETLVLIEDASDTLGGDGNAPHRDAVTPQILHFDPSNAPSLADVLPGLIRDWHNAEPETAKAAMLAEERVAELRDRTLREMTRLGDQERADLSTATERAVQELQDQATRAADHIESATEPVVEADQVVARLNAALEHAGLSLEAAVDGLRQAAHELTGPRRAWISEHTSRVAAQLADTAPLSGEAAGVERMAEESCVRLVERTTALGNAASQLASYRPRFDGIERDATTAAEQAESERRGFEARAGELHRSLEARAQRAATELAAAQRRRDEVLARRRQVEQQETELRAYVAENERIDRENLRRAEEALRQRNAAEAERVRLEMVRDSQIPQLDREAEAAEKRLRQIDPDGICRQLADVQTKLKLLAAQVAEAERLRERLMTDLAKVRDEKTALEAKEREVENLERERGALKLKIKDASELEDALRNLRADIRELKAKLRKIDALTISASELVRQAAALLRKARKFAPSTTLSKPHLRLWWPWGRK